MKRAAQILALTVSAVLVCAACSRIKLDKGAGALTAPPSSGAGFSLPNISALFNAPPPLSGVWNITFVYKDQQAESSVNFSQNGRTLAGDGRDGNGKQFVIVNGTVDGTKVHFFKKYTDADPSKPMVEYTGELTYQNDQDFKGWSIGGHYKTNINGEAVDDKWVAVSQAAESAQQPAQPAQQQPPQGEQQQAPPDQTAAQPGDQQSADTSNGGEQSSDIPDNVSGMYTARYEFNFRPVESRLWLKQDNAKITGDGTDTNTHEYFTISKGFFNAPADKAPRVMLTFHYEKGKHATKDRELTVRATVGPGPSLRGETQFGSPWTASFVAH